jgi:hypothetical protein
MSTRLQVEAAGIEANALPDQRDAWRLIVAPSHIEQGGLTDAGTPHRVDRGIVLMQQSVAANDARFGAAFPCDLLSGRHQFIRSHVFGGRVDEIAREADRARQPLYFAAIGFARPNQTSRLALRFLVSTERIGAERPTQRHGCRSL